MEEEKESIDPMKILSNVDEEEMKEEVENIKGCPCMLFFNTFRWSAKQTHLWHFQTDNRALHKELQKYYEGVIDIMDEFVETYSGHYGRPEMEEFSKTIENLDEEELESQIKDHFTVLFATVDGIRNHNQVKQKPSLVNIIDDLDTFLNKTMYLLTFK